MGLAWLFLTTFWILPSRTSTERIPSSRLRLTRSSITMSLLWLLPRSSRSSLSRGVAPHRPLQFWLFYCARYALRETGVNPFARKAKKWLKKQLKEIRIAGGKFCARSRHRKPERGLLGGWRGFSQRSCLPWGRGDFLRQRLPQSQQENFFLRWQGCWWAWEKKI